jgi:hypothetical protein
MLRVKILTATENRQKFETSILVFRTFLLYEGTEEKKDMKEIFYVFPPLKREL